ncbi:unnamed protein product [Trichobilharzia szidati]|nr:unnamed protein product [Trichobilharzia szidati]
MVIGTGCCCCCWLVIFITSVLSMFTWSPVFAASSTSLSVFACKSSILCDIKHKSSAKSRSSRFFTSVQDIPVFSFPTV